ncbi:hypothetical protein [Coralloluteibacterium thermophilus]|uniref:Uncharacterized protein n=1 Tax=Coralloluteibacterium thermophilum TaxID=2707049 RepID=A0ABV9NIU5_9GAMM
MGTRTLIAAATAALAAFGGGWLLGSIQTSRSAMADQIVANWVAHAIVVIDEQGQRRRPEDAAAVADGVVRVLAPLAGEMFAHAGNPQVQALARGYAKRIHDDPTLVQDRFDTSEKQRVRMLAAVACLADDHDPRATSACTAGTQP